MWFAPPFPASLLAPFHSVRLALTPKVSHRFLIAALMAVIGVDQLLLWRFLDWAPIWLYPLAVAAIAGLCLGLVRSIGWRSADGPSLSLCLVAFVFALLLFLLGGEARLVYANSDWQVRTAVLHDLVRYPWPFSYDFRAESMLLRAPLGMYLKPALAGKLVSYRFSEWFLLLQNAGYLAILLALSSSLFEGAAKQWRMLLLFWAFSGMDVLGTMLAGSSLAGHLEWWAGVQFSSEVTLAFWVPQHALVGWTGAVLFLLWREDRIPLVAFLTPLPLLVLWSPLGLFGTIPFAALAGVESIARGRIRPIDIGLPALASVLAIPGLLYLAAGSASVGGKFYLLPLNRYVAFEALEVLPILLACAFLRPRFGKLCFLLVAAMLLLLPFGQVGHQQDFPMRASITPLAILALTAGDALVRGSVRVWSNWRIILVAVLAVGAVTPISEIIRAVTYPRSPLQRCGYFGIVPSGADTYVVPVSDVSSMIAPVRPAEMAIDEPTQCFDRPWPLPPR